MNNPVESPSDLSNAGVAQLKEQFERIDTIIEGGGAVKLDLTEHGRTISLTINRDRVVEGDAPLEARATRRTRSRGRDKNLAPRPPTSFSFDIGYINRQVRAEDIEAQIKTASEEQTKRKTERRMRSRKRSAAAGAKASGGTQPGGQIHRRKYLGLGRGLRLHRE